MRSIAKLSAAAALIATACLAQAEGVGLARAGGEVVHLVVQHEARAGHHHRVAERQVHGLRHRGQVAVAVDDRKMRRIVARRRRFDARQQRARHRAVEADARAQARGVVVAEQQRERHLHEIGIAEVDRAVAVDPAHRLDLHMQARHAIELGQRVAGQDLEQPDQRDAAGGWRRRGQDGLAAVVETQRLAFNCLVGGKVLVAPDAAGRTHALHQGACGLAGIETGVAFGSDAFEDRGDVAVVHPRAGFRGLAAGQEQGRSAG